MALGRNTGNKMANKSARNIVLDVAKGLGIFLVLFGHLIPFETDVAKAIFNFHMPLFFFISGVFFSVKGETFRQHVFKSFLSMGIPFAVFCVLGTISYPLRGSFVCDSSYEWLWRIVRFYDGHPFVNASLWFLIALFGSRLLCYLFVKARFFEKKCWIVLLFGLYIVAYLILLLPARVKQLIPLMLPVVPMTTFWMMLGYKMSGDVVKFTTAKGRWMCFGFAFVALAFEILLSIQISPSTLSACRVGSPFFVVTGGLGIGFVLCFAKVVSNSRVGFLFAIVGRNSLYFFGLDFVAIGITECLLFQGAPHGELRRVLDYGAAAQAFACQLIIISLMIPFVKKSIRTLTRLSSVYLKQAMEA